LGQHSGLYLAEKRVRHLVKQLVAQAQKLRIELIELRGVERQVGTLVAGVSDLEYEILPDAALHGEIPLLVIRGHHRLGPRTIEPEADLRQQTVGGTAREIKAAGKWISQQIVRRDPVQCSQPRCG